MFNLTEITQYHTFSALSEVLLDCRSEAHLCRKPCVLRFTKGSLVLMLIRCEHSRALLLILLVTFFVLDYSKRSRVPDLYRKARSSYSSRCTELVRRCYPCYSMVLLDYGGIWSVVLFIQQGKAPSKSKVIY